MKNRIFILALLLLFSGFGFSQNKKVDRAELEAKKKAFILKEVDLSEQEAAVFWPVYQSFDKAVEEIRNKRRKIRGMLKNDNLLSDQELYNLTVKLLTLEKKEAEIRLQYLDEFVKVIGKHKAAKVFKVEEQWKRELLGMIKRRHMPPPPPPRD